MTTFHMLVNSAASKGRASNTAERTIRLLKQRGVNIVRLAVDKAAVVAEAISEARSNGMERLVVVGGDGLIHHALPALANTGITVSIIPSGTGNDFARALGIPTKTSRAVDLALEDGVPVDLIKSGDRWAASVVTGGWSGDVNQRATQLRFPRGKHRYTLATLLELGGLKPVSLRLEVDGVTHDKEVILFAIGNTAYFGGGMKVCPNALPSDGLLEVAILESVSARQLLSILPKIFSGKHIDHPRVSTWRAKSLKISTPAELWADGEPFGKGAAELKTSVGALLVAGASAAS